MYAQARLPNYIAYIAKLTIRKYFQIGHPCLLGPFGYPWSPFRLNARGGSSQAMALLGYSEKSKHNTNRQCSDLAHKNT